MEQVNVLEEKKNYIKEYFKNETHDLSSILKVENLENDKIIMSIKREINKLLKEIENKGIELGKEVAKSYSKNYTPIDETIYIDYCGELFDINSGLKVYNGDIDENNMIYRVDKKKGEKSVIVGYDYDLASIIVRTYRYTIATNNEKITMKLLNEMVLGLFENKMAKMSFENIENPNIMEKELNYSYYGDDLDFLRNIKNYTFINTLFDCNYEGNYDLKELWKYYQTNKSFEIILKTSPKEIVDDLLKMEKIDKALPIHKIIGITLDTYNLAVKNNIIDRVVNCRDLILKNTLNKTEKEWLDFIDEIKNYEEDLDFYNISYGSYWNERDDLLKVICEEYCDYKIFSQYYSIGKFTNYVVNETINQGYERVRDFIGDLKDYLRMCEEENVNPTLYSSYLRQTHDITKRNHKIVVEEENEKIFKDRYKDFKTYVGTKYKVFCPKCSNDLKQEGDNLNHCVASYIKRVIDGECLIYFLRTRKDESLITFEVRNNTIMQVKGKHNRKPTKDEEKALQDFAKCRNLKVNF